MLGMQPLGHEDALHLKAAQGWLELGNHQEANEELERITPKLRAHPQVLALRWQVYAKAQKWDGAADIARALTQLLPSTYFSNVGLFSPILSPSRSLLFLLLGEEPQKNTGRLRSQSPSWCQQVLP